MPPERITQNTLFYGDNLPIMREYIADESVDLIYLDPPFNSNRSYNVLFKHEGGDEAEAQIAAFDDTWHWGPIAEQTYHELVTDGPAEVSTMIGALRQFIGTNQMMAYLIMMAVRLLELHRVLRPTGSIYLHCDPTASHYLKIVMDTIFGPANFRNEVIWKRTSAHNDPSRCGSIHDTLLFYSRSDNYIWNDTFQAYSEEYTQQYYRYRETDGRRFMSADLTGAGSGPLRSFGEHGEIAPPPNRHWMYAQEGIDRLLRENRIYWTRNGIPRFKKYLDESAGLPLQDVWDDIQALRSWHKELLGYPTQKPFALLERIIQASSNEGDVVLDPFCGCGTTIGAAQKLGRRWIGIDLTHLAVALIKYRLEDMFPGVQFKVIGEPQSVPAARQLAQDNRFQFEWWALSLVQAKPTGAKGQSRRGKKGADKGIDGVINFIDEAKGKAKRVLVQVKSGDIRDLRGTVERENAAMGVFVTLEEPSRQMKTEAVTAGYYHSPGWEKDYPRIQILTIGELLNRAKVDMPPQYGTFKQAPKAERHGGKQEELGI